jgi:diaminohydroxyphosphoribosylaminopyrimidine deaminase/5-amino-6-(5-phosphoribosylamino)uracil reductase
LRTPLTASIVDINVAPTWIFTTDEADKTKAEKLRAAGVEVISTGAGPRVNLDNMLETLGSKGILSLLVEGGSQVNAAMLHGNHVQKVISFLAPKLLGGVTSPSAIAGESPAKMADALELERVSWQQFDDDLCVTGYLTSRK